MNEYGERGVVGVEYELGRRRDALLLSLVV
jgi:hypothetical protein